MLRWLQMEYIDNMKESSKQTIRNYLRAINIDNIPFGTKDYPFTRLEYVKSLTAFVIASEGIWEKMKAWYPFMDMSTDKLYVNASTANETRLDFGKGWLTNIDLTETDKTELKNAAEKASSKLTRKIK